MSYNTLAEAQLFDVGLTQAHLTDATVYLEARYGPLWPGRIADTTQVENWPRVSADGSTLTDANGRDLTDVPAAVKRAELEAAKLILSGGSLLATSVATASSVSATVGGQLTHSEVQAGSVKTIEKYSATSSESTSGATVVQEIDENGYPIIKLLDGLLWAIVSAQTASNNTNNYYLLRA